MIKKPLTAKQLQHLRDCLRQLPDPRQARGTQHPFRAIIAIAICAILSGARSYLAIGEWAKACSPTQLKRLGAYYDRRKKCFIPPSESCIRRTLQRADATTIDRLIGQWVLATTQPERAVISVDGKTLRGTSTDKAQQIHLLSAFVQEHGVIVAQDNVEHHPQEPRVLCQLLEQMPVTEGTLITADALHTKRNVAQAIIKKKPIIC